MHDKEKKLSNFSELKALDLGVVSHKNMDQLILYTILK